MRRKAILILSAILSLSLTGCSGIRNRLGEQILQQSRVLEKDDYKKYEQYEESGNLDAEGYYTEKTDVYLGCKVYFL